jgi:cytochrome c
MKTLLNLAALLLASNVSLALAAGTPAFDAAAATRLANQNACFGCHQVARQVVGPSFQQIAAKYQGDAGAPAKMALKIKLGGSGVWGMIPMPAHPTLSDADLKLLSAWVLAGAPK